MVEFCGVCGSYGSVQEQMAEFYGLCGSVQEQIVL